MRTAAIIEKEILATLDDIGAKIQVAGIQTFMAKIQPEIELAVKSNDIMSMDYLRDRVAIQVAQTTLNLNQAERAAVTNTVITVLRVLIAVGVAAI